MKRLLPLLLLACSFTLNAQRVGIGITNPQEKLHVDSSIKIGLSPWSSSIHNRFFKIGDGNGVTIGETGRDDRLEFSAREFLFRSSGQYPDGLGRVGINISTAPSAFLEVNGNVKITDGTQGMGKVLTTDDNGLASWKPVPNAQSGFNVFRQNSNIVVADATDQAIVFDGQRFADIVAYNTSTGLFTVPVNGSGAYQFNLKIQWRMAPSSQANLSVYLTVNNTKVEESNESISTSANSDNKMMTIATLLRLNAGDVVKVVVRQESGNNQEISIGGSSFSGFRVY